MNKISCIIAAYNEEPRISQVLEAVDKHPLIYEILVVDDGSKDRTCDKVKEFKDVRLIQLPKNGGKSKAVLAGIRAAKGDLLLFLDADLIGITSTDVTDLIQPVLSGISQVSISLRKNNPWRSIGIDYISGERVFPKALIEPCLDEIADLPRFGLEAFFNKSIIQAHCSIKVVDWKNVISPLKFKKSGLIAGIKGDIFMISNILKVISPLEVVSQIVAMSRLRVD